MKKHLRIALDSEYELKKLRSHTVGSQAPRVAVVGAGAWGQDFIRNFSELGVLVAVCDASQKNLVELRHQYPKIHFTTAYKEVLDNPDVNGVIIATPAKTHYRLTKQALRVKKHVCVRKPLAVEIEEAEELVALAEKSKCLLMVGHILRYHPAINKLKKLIDSGVLGSIRYIYSRRLNIGKIRSEESILWSFAPHDISAILFLLGEQPQSVSAHGSAYVKNDVADVTVTVMEFPSGVKSHIFVSWLHPFKEQRLVVVGGEKMAVFDDLTEEKLFLYPHSIEWQNQIPVAGKTDVEVVPFDMAEPLRRECRHFLDCIEFKKKPTTDGEEGLRVLKILTAAQQSLFTGGQKIQYPQEIKKYRRREKISYYAHPTACVGEDCIIGKGTKIWNNSQIQPGARIGENCVIGHNCFVASRAIIGNGVKLECNVDVWDLVTLEDYVFVGPSAVFTNDINPRAKYSKQQYPEYGEWIPTVVKEGASIGANATIICGTTIGKGAMVGAGAVVRKDIPDYAIVVGIPARVIGWICECGSKLKFTRNRATCPTCSRRYKKTKDAVTQIMELC